MNAPPHTTPTLPPSALQKRLKEERERRATAGFKALLEEAAEVESRLAVQQLEEEGGCHGVLCIYQQWGHILTVGAHPNSGLPDSLTPPCSIQFAHQQPDFPSLRVCLIPQCIPHAAPPRPPVPPPPPRSC